MCGPWALCYFFCVLSFLLDFAKQAVWVATVVVIAGDSYTFIACTNDKSFRTIFFVFKCTLLSPCLVFICGWWRYFYFPLLETTRYVVVIASVDIVPVVKKSEDPSLL